MKKRKRGRPKNSKNQDKILIKIKENNPEKANLIKTIWKLQPEYKTLDINLNKYSIAQLEKHIKLFKLKQEKKT